jgi:hypothetical protein
MARILFAWEMGRNLGHLSRDLPLARACRDAGHHVVMTAPDLRAAGALLRDEGLPLVQAPMLNRVDAPRPAPVNFADMLLHLGYADEATLAGALAGWRGLFELGRPDVVVFDHAPTALIAARQLGIPVLVQGTGFEIPPGGSPMPGFRPWEPVDRERLEQAEADVLRRINGELLRFGALPLERLADLFVTPHTLLTTFPELDPFGPRDGAHYVGPVFALPSPKESRGGPRLERGGVFAYLRKDIPGCEALLQALQALRVDVLCAVPDLPDEWAARYPRLRFVAGTIDIHAVLPEAALVITSGAGTIATALLAGVPVLVIPQFVEQYLAGLALQRTGAGLTMRDRRNKGLCTAMLDQLLNGTRYREAARAFAQRHASFDPASTLALQRTLIEALAP